MDDKLIVNLHLADTCNFQCVHCFAHFGAKQDLSVNEWKKIIDNALENGNIRRFNLAGGEPLLYSGIFEVSDYIRSKGCEVSVITNGFTLSEQKIDRLEECGVSMIGLSIDSANPQTLAKLGRKTKTGHILDPMRCIKLCRRIREKRITLKVNTVVSKINYTEDMNSFIKEVSPDRWKLLKIKKFQNCNFDNTSLLISDAEFDMFSKRHREIPRIIERDMANTYIMVDAFGNLIDTGSNNNTPVANLLTVNFKKAFSLLNFNYDSYRERYADLRQMKKAKCA